MQREQRLQFLARQPQARQLEAFGLIGGVAEGSLALAFDRRAKRVAQEGDVAVGRGARTLELIEQPRERHRVARALEDAMQRQYAFVAIHAAMVRELINACRRGGFRRESKYFSDVLPTVDDGAAIRLRCVRIKKQQSTQVHLSQKILLNVFLMPA